MAERVVSARFSDGGRAVSSEESVPDEHASSRIRKAASSVLAISTASRLDKLSDAASPGGRIENMSAHGAYAAGQVQGK